MTIHFKGNFTLYLTPPSLHFLQTARLAAVAEVTAAAAWTTVGTVVPLVAGTGDRTDRRPAAAAVVTMVTEAAGRDRHRTGSDHHQ